MEKTLQSAEQISLIEHDSWFIVTCWDINGECRWEKKYRDYDKAVVEYDRWD